MTTTTPTTRASITPADRSHFRGSVGAALLTVLVTVATPATVIVGLLAMMRPLLPPETPLSGLGIALAAPAVGVTLLSFGSYLKAAVMSPFRSLDDPAER